MSPQEHARKMMVEQLGTMVLQVIETQSQLLAAQEYISSLEARLPDEAPEVPTEYKNPHEAVGAQSGRIPLRRAGTSKK